MRPSVACVIACIVSTALVRAEGQKVAVADVVRGAERVVIGRVAAVSGRFGTNEFGDQLILSDVRIQVEEVLKGRSTAAVDLELEGGTVGDLRLDVSDLPAMTSGERAVFFLTTNPAGRSVPYRRGHGIKKLNAAGEVAGEAISLADIRRLCAAHR